MTNKSYHLATLHRGRYMFILLAGVCLVTALVARVSISEIIKILIVLASLPLLMFCGIRWSRNDSEWTIVDGRVEVVFKKEPKLSFSVAQIKYMRNLPRSGGNLLMIFYKKGLKPKRFWRNKLFEKPDDLDALVHALKQAGVEYYYM